MGLLLLSRATQAAPINIHSYAHRSAGATRSGAREKGARRKRKTNMKKKIRKIELEQ